MVVVVDVVALVVYLLEKGGGCGGSGGCLLFCKDRVNNSSSLEIIPKFQNNSYR